MTNRAKSLHACVKPLALLEPRLTSAEIYERIKDDWQDVNQEWLRRTIVSYRSIIPRRIFRQKGGLYPPRIPGSTGT